MRTLLPAIAFLIAFPCFLQAQQTAAAGQAYTIYRMAEKFHVEPRPMDDRFSKDLLTQLLKMADEKKLFFTQEDIRRFNAWALTLDDEIKAKKTDFINLFSTVYQQRMKRTDSIITQVCNGKPLTAVSKLPGDSNYAADLAAVRAKLMRVLSRGDNCRVLRRQVNRVLLNPSGVATVAANLYCKAIALCYDPHTEYLPKTEKENLESELGQQPFRFGFRMKEEKEEVVIDNLEPGSPAFKSGLLNKGDKIVSVQWEGKQPVDVSAAGIEELSSVLDMSNHDKLMMQVQKKDGTMVKVPLQKEKSESDDDDNKVKSFVLKGSSTIGYLYLPAFYEDWTADGNGLKGCANDVAREIIKLKKENIQGLILDLRFNGGGSVQEAAELTGIFIDAGPVALFKTKAAKPFIINDVNRGTVWDGPLVVMVNRLSASASEMVAGALQDYNRAVIVGSTTYGKATGQIILPMDTAVELESKKDITTDNYIKITTSKLYRVNGTTAQAAGVTPSVLLPDLFATVVEREADEPFALSSSRIDANKYYRPYPVIPQNFTTSDTATNGKVTFTVENNQYEQSLLSGDAYLEEMNTNFKDALKKDDQLQVAFNIVTRIKK